MCLFFLLPQHFLRILGPVGFRGFLLWGFWFGRRSLWCRSHAGYLPMSAPGVPLGWRLLLLSLDPATSSFIVTGFFALLLLGVLFSVLV